MLLRKRRALSFSLKAGVQRAVALGKEGSYEAILTVSSPAQTGTPGSWLVTGGPGSKNGV